MKTSKENKATQSQLAKSLGVTRQLIAFHRKRLGKQAPALSDVEGWRSYFAAYGRAGSAPKELRDEIARTKLSILKEVRRDKARTNKAKDAEVMDAATVRRFLDSLVFDFM